MSTVHRLVLCISTAMIVVSGCSSDSDPPEPTSTSAPFTQSELEEMTPLAYYLEVGTEEALARCFAGALSDADIENMVDFEALDPASDASMTIDAAFDDCIDAGEG